MSKQPKKKPTLKELIQAINQVYRKIDLLDMEIYNLKKIQDMYIKFKDDEENFLEYIREALKVDDKDTKKTEDK
jgi:HPt (histidine-containing phosphotransfer) domain-containing protein